MARAVISAPQRRAAGEPLYDFDARTGATVEVFYADRVLAKSFGTRPGWFWWTCRPGFLPDVPPRGPFASGYLAYRNIAMRWLKVPASFASIRAVAPIVNGASEKNEA
jgi:hypothetical protein